jgi:hypothetical protein
MEFDLEVFTQNSLKYGYNMLRDSEQSLSETKKQANRIKSLFQNYSTEKSLNKDLYGNLITGSHVLKLATLEIIEKYPAKKSLSYLFEAMENENNMIIRQKILDVIDNIEMKGNLDSYKDRKISIVSALKYSNSQ